MAVEFSVELKGGKKVNKIEVAKQQLDAAIMLLFNESEYIPIHTLAAAASQVFEDVCISKRIESESSRIFVNYLSEGKLSVDAVKAIRRHRNFFKHADKDPDEIIELPDSRFVETLIYQAIVDCDGLGFESTIPMRTFYIWFLIKYPQSLDFALEDGMGKALQAICTAIVNFSRGETLRFGLLLFHINSNNFDEVRGIVKDLQKSINGDILALISKLRSS